MCCVVLCCVVCCLLCVVCSVCVLCVLCVNTLINANSAQIDFENSLRGPKFCGATTYHVVLSFTPEGRLGFDYGARNYLQWIAIAEGCGGFRCGVATSAAAALGSSL